MPLLIRDEEKEKHTPWVIWSVLGMEWVLAVIFATSFCIYLWTVFVWDVLGGRAVAFTIHGDEYTTDEVMILSATFIGAAGLSFSLVALLGKGISQRSITKCKIWIFTSSFMLLSMFVTFAFFLLQNTLDNYYFLLAIIYLGYKPFTIVAVYNFVRQLQQELQDEFKLFPSPFV